MVRAQKQVNQNLNEMVTAGRSLSYSLVRKFVVNFYSLELADLFLYSAMKAPSDNIFCQNRRSEAWAFHNANTTRHEIQNAKKYQKQLRF